MTATDPRPQPAAAPAGEPADAPDDRVTEPESGSGYDGSEDEYNFGELRRAAICRQADDAAFSDRLTRRERRQAAARGAEAAEEVKGWTASCPNRLRNMPYAHAEHDIS